MNTNFPRPSNKCVWDIVPFHVIIIYSLLLFIITPSRKCQGNVWFSHIYIKIHHALPKCGYGVYKVVLSTSPVSGTGIGTAFTIFMSEILEQVYTLCNLYLQQFHFNILFNLCTVIAVIFLDWFDKLKKPFMCKTWWFLSCMQYKVHIVQNEIKTYFIQNYSNFAHILKIWASFWIYLTK